MRHMADAADIITCIKTINNKSMLHMINILPAYLMTCKWKLAMHQISLHALRWILNLVLNMMNILPAS